MNIVNGSRRLRRLSISLVLLLSNCAQIIVLVGSSSSTDALAAQKQFTSSPNDRRVEIVEIDDKASARARRTGAPTEVFQYPSVRGPIIRVALMTDVASIALSSSTGLSVGSATGFDDPKLVSTPTLTVELRPVPEPGMVETRLATYRVGVGSSGDSRRARKLVDELEKKFFEPVAMTYDEKQKGYSVLIGQFPNQGEAARFLERLRRSGYESLRVLSDQTTTGTQPAESFTDQNARAAKYKAQPTSTSVSSGKTYRRTSQLIAFDAEKRVAALSEGELVVAPAKGPRQLDRSRQSTGLPGHDETNTQGAAVDGKSAPGVAATVVRVGKTDYRGEIHLVLNPRGRINVVNVLPLEDYLRGVVPMELSPGAYPEIEALKAQAVAARSYALARLGRHLDEGYDLVDDTRAQVYGGLSTERELTNRAIDETRGIAAVFPNEEGKLVPIEALYTANCGGSTENNDEVFGGKTVPYLRAVSCSPDRQSPAGRDITSSRTRDVFIGGNGRSIAREVGLLSVIGFSFPRSVTNSYLNRSAEPDEVHSWIEQTARLTQRPKPGFGDGTRLAEFARLVAISIYGEGRASTLLSPADVDYLLGGLRVQRLAREERADIALLLRDGILRVPADSELDGRAQITRGQAIETLARAILIHQPATQTSQTSDSKAQTSNSRFRISGFISDVAVPAENGRLMTVSVPAKAPHRDGQRSGVEISDEAWLFRNLGGESYQVDRLTLIGGERIFYHLNPKGQVDFLEAWVSDRTASSDRFSSVAQWRERITVLDLQQRLARARINVGRPEKVEPVAFSTSSRVTEIEVTGDETRARLRRSQIRAVLGLKEYLFVVDRETDAGGKVVAFVFTGRGWGHGVGMCQTGAYGLALEGYSYSAILQKYYTGVKLRKMY